MLCCMASGVYSVSVVVDRDYGPEIRELLESGPVWVVNSPNNQESAQSLWKEHPNRTHLDGVTVFKAPEDRSPEQIFLDQIGTIDLHHGEYSADPAYTVIRCYGCKLTPEIRDALTELGFDSFKSLDEGFEVTRPSAPYLND